LATLRLVRASAAQCAGRNVVSNFSFISVTFSLAQPPGPSSADGTGS